MKKILFVLVLSLFFCSSAIGQHRDSVKTGWNFGALPAISFDSNLGFQYGALVNLFYYGDGSTYPVYRHSIYAEVSRYTKGTTVFRTYYDSKFLIPKIRINVDAAYLTDQMMILHGFNGYKARYMPEYIDPESDNYISKGFYGYDRKMLRFLSYFEGNIASNLKWAAGADVYSFDINSVNKGKLDLPEDSTLYEYYTAYGGIAENQKNGGTHIYIKGGLIYDTRDFEPNPMSGMRTELLFFASPDVEGKGLSHIKMAFTHRQYFTLVKQRLSFAYRVSYHGTIAGTTPWYLQQTIHTPMLRRTLSEGLGSNTTMRGVVRNRIVGDGVAYANLELRWKFLYFRLLNQNFYLATTPFIDAGMVVQPYNKDRLEEMQRNIDLYSVKKPQLVTTSKEVPHVCAGIGVQAAMNQNFILSVDVGKALDGRDGNMGFYIGLNYIF